MPRSGPNGRCAVCGHEQRSLIETMMATGVSTKRVGERFGVHWAAVHRHWHHHTPPSVRAARAANALRPGVELDKLINDESAGLLEHLQNVRGKLYLLFDTAVEVGDRNAAALLSGRLHENLTIVARLTGELMKHATPTVTNVLVNPDVLQLMHAVRAAVAPFPEARQAVVAALAEIEQRAAARYAQSQPLIEAQRAS